MVSSSTGCFTNTRGSAPCFKTGLHLHSSWMHFWQWVCWYMPLPESQSAESNGIGLLCFRSSVDLDVVSHFMGGSTSAETSDLFQNFTVLGRIILQKSGEM